MQPFDSLLSKRDCIKLKGFFHQLKQLADRSYFAIIAVDSKQLNASFTETIRQNSAIRSEWTEISHSEQLAEIMHDKSGNTCLKVLDLTAIGTQAADRARLNLHFNRDYIIDYNLKIVLLCSFDFFTQILNHAYDLASIAHFSGFFSDREQVVTKDTKKAETTPEYETYLADLSNLIDYQKQENADEEIIMRKSLSAGLSASTVSELSEALNLWSSGLKIALKKNDLQFQTYFLGNIGVIHSNQGNLDQALTYQKQALEIDQQIGYKQGEANQLGNIGNIYSAQGDLDQALTYHQQALEIDKQIGDLQGEAYDLGNIGNIYSAQGDLDQALTDHQQALEIHKQIGDLQGEATALGNIGNIYSDQGDLDQALTYHQQALEIDKQIGYKQGEAIQLGNIGNIYSDQGDLDQALTYLKQALEIDKQIGYLKGEASVLGSIGNIYSAQGDLDQALAYLKQALEIFQIIGQSGEILKMEKIIEEINSKC